MKIYAILILLACVAATSRPASTTESRHDDDILAARAWLYQYKTPADHAVFRRLADWSRSHPDDPETLFYVYEAVEKKKLQVDDADPLKMLKQVAGGGFPAAQALFAMLQLTGDGVPEDRSAGLKTFRTLVVAHCYDVFFYEGFFFEEGKAGFRENPAKAIPALQAAAAAGIVKAWGVLGMAEAKLGESENAINAERFGADAGDPGAQEILGSWYEVGHLIPVDQQKAIDWMTKAATAEPNNSEYARNLGLLYFHAEGQTGHLENAFNWLTRSANLGNKDSALDVAKAYLSGIGVAMNTKEAVKRLRALSDSGMPLAEAELGAMYLEGVLLPRDVARARELFVKAEKGGDASAAVYVRWLDQSFTTKSLDANLPATTQLK